MLRQFWTRILLYGMVGIWWSERKGAPTLIGSGKGKHVWVVIHFQSLRKRRILDLKMSPKVWYPAVSNLEANCWLESLFGSLWGEFDMALVLLSLWESIPWLLQLPQHNHSHCGVWNTWSCFSRPLSKINLQSQSSAFLWKNCSFTTLYSFHFVSCKNRIVRIFVTESLEMLTQNRQKCWHRIVRNVDT